MTSRSLSMRSRATTRASNNRSGQPQRHPAQRRALPRRIALAGQRRHGRDRRRGAALSGRRGDAAGHAAHARAGHPGRTAHRRPPHAGARPLQRRRAGGPQRVALPRRGGAPGRRPRRDPRSGLPQRHARQRRARTHSPAHPRLRGGNRALPAAVRRCHLRRALRAGRAAPGRRGRRHARGGEADPRRDHAQRGAGAARRLHRRERLRQDHAAEGARRRHDAVQRLGHGQWRAGDLAPHRHRLPAPGRDRAPRPHGHGVAALLRAPAPALGQRRGGDQFHRQARPARAGARVARRHAHRLAVRWPAQARRPCHRDPQPPQPAVFGRAHDRPRPGS